MFKFYSDLSFLGKLIFYLSLLIVICSIFYQCYICKFIPLKLIWEKNSESGQVEPVVVQESVPVNVLPPVEMFQDNIVLSRSIPRRVQRLQRDTRKSKSPLIRKRLSNPQKRVRFSDQILQKNPESKLILFYADWCSHCQRFKPKWNQLVNSLKGIVKTISVNGEKRENQKILKKYGVDKYPTVILDDGSKKIEYDGEMTIDGLKQFVYTKQNNGSYSQNIVI
jgi:thiol-disulfide isomerase/thioredoxin